MLTGGKDELVGHKIDVRFAIEMFLYEAADQASDVDKKQERMDHANAIMGMIEELNARIVEVDNGLRTIKT